MLHAFDEHFRTFSKPRDRKKIMRILYSYLVAMIINTLYNAARGFSRLDGSMKKMVPKVLTVSASSKSHSNVPSRDSFIDDFIAPWENFPFGSLARSGTNVPLKQFAPLLSADLIESESDYHIHLDLPGVQKEDLDIQVSDGTVSIKAERKYEVDEKDDNDKVR